MPLQFDLVIGNPPYTTFKIGANNPAGVTNGNLYRKFTKAAFKYAKTETGIVVFVVLRGIVGWFKKKNSMFQVDVINLMTKTNYWRYNTCWFKAINKKKITEPKYEIDIIINKCFAVNDWKTKVSATSNKNLQASNFFKIYKTAYPVISRLPGRVDIQRAYVENATYYDPGPKVAFTLLESKKSYIATEEAVATGCAITVYVDTMQQAEGLRLFLLHSPIITYMQKKFKTRSRGECIGYLKWFDASQIITGLEYPKEFNLTEQEIKEIENAI